MAAGSNNQGSTRVDRRRLLKTMAIGAAGVGGAMAGLGGSAVAPALADSPPPSGGNARTSTDRGVVPAAGPRVTLPAATAGMSYVTVAGGQFVSGYSTTAYGYAYPGGMRSGGAGFFSHTISLPQGALISEVMVVGAAASGYTDTYLLMAWRLDQLSPGYVEVALGTNSNTTATAVNCTTTPTTVDNANWAYNLEWDAGTTGANLYSARVGYRDAAPPLHTITPVRVYDSRSSDGPIGSGVTRTISVANSITGVSDVVPVGASAITYNLTVVDTTGGGYVALFPYGTTWGGNSSINWAPSWILANGGVVKLGGNRQVNALCSGSSADFIVDVTGYYL